MKIEIIVILHYVLLMLISISLSFHSSHIKSLQREIEKLKGKSE